jgi:hypothetical protein
METSISSMQGQPSALVTNLKRLPLEIVHRILDDLPLVKVLQLLSHKTYHVERCILTHLHLRKLFGSLSDIATVIDYFILFRDIRRYIYQPLTENLHNANIPPSLRGLLAMFQGNIGGVEMMSLNYSVLRSEVQFSISHLKYFLIASIREHLQLKPVELDLLRRYASTNFPVTLGSSCENFFMGWLWIKEAKRQMNVVKAGQLAKVADLVMSYPGKVILKKPFDPRQASPRLNIFHIANRFRSDSRKCLRDHTLITSSPNWRCYPGVDLIELIPYDRYLWLFLDTLEKHPPMDDIEGIEAGLRKVTLSEAMGASSMLDGTNRKVQGEKYQYPADITANIKVVMKGLFYVYTGSPLLIIPRVQLPAASKPYFVNSGKKPRFYIEMKPHSENLPVHLHRCPVKKRRPHDEREYEWLEAFLKVVTWMEKEFVDYGSEPKF